MLIRLPRSRPCNGALHFRSIALLAAFRFVFLVYSVQHTYHQCFYVNVGSEEQNSTFYRSTARFRSNALCVLGYTALALVVSSIWRIQGAFLVKQDAGPRERFLMVGVIVIVGDVATALFSLTF